VTFPGPDVKSRRLAIALLSAAVLLAVGRWIAAPRLWPRLSAQGPSDRVSYTTAQAERGRAVYAEHCASCHGPHLDDGAFGPSLVGVEFRLKWGSSSVAELFQDTSTRMPPAAPGSLGDARYAELVSLMLQANGSPVGAQELAVDVAALKAMPAPGWARPLGGGLAKGLVLPSAPPRENPLDTIQPVSAVSSLRLRERHS
jgi:mono/diheme cytochrome c family protein